jgi:hypothetical protein
MAHAFSRALAMAAIYSLFLPEIAHLRRTTLEVRTVTARR